MKRQSEGFKTEGDSLTRQTVAFAWFSFLSGLDPDKFNLVFMRYLFTSESADAIVNG